MGHEICRRLRDCAVSGSKSLDGSRSLSIPRLRQQSWVRLYWTVHVLVEIHCAVEDLYSTHYIKRLGHAGDSKRKDEENKAGDALPEVHSKDMV